MSYIKTVFADPDALFALYTDADELIKEFYDWHTADLAALHLDVIGRIPDDEPIDWPLPDDANPPE